MVWLTILAWVILALAGVSALVLTYRIFGTDQRQPMPIMDVVWPITGLYFGPVGVWGWFRLVDRSGTSSRAPAWRSGALSASHCGAGCVLGDIVGGWAVFVTGWTLFGERLFSEYVLEFALAWLFGVAFQYFSIKPMNPDMSRGKALTDAVKADTLSIVAFQLGMFGWMALVALVFFRDGLAINGPVFWFMMQIGLVIGFCTTYPVNRWLVRAGIKHAM